MASVAIRSSFVRSQNSRGRRMRRNQNVHRIGTNRRMGPVSIMVVVALIVGVMALLYLTQVTKTSVYGYEINELEVEQTELQQRQQELAVEAARLQSIDRLKSSTALEGLESQQQVGYSGTNAQQ